MSTATALPGFRSGVIFIPYRYVALVLLIVQTTAVVLCMRQSRTTVAADGHRYLSSTAVVMSELFKVIGSLGLLWLEDRPPVRTLLATVYDEVFLQWRGTLLLAVPAVLYTVQNNLLFVALSNLSAATYQITYQLKILAAAVFSAVLLGRRFAPMKWFSLFVLMAGVALVQWPDAPSGTKSPESAHLNPLVGLIAVLCACCSSGFAGVYFEKILKGTRESVWIRNIQLGLFGAALGFLGVLMNDSQPLAEHGFFQGYNGMTWLVVCLQAFGGLVIAAVIKYADNILKSFATSLSIILTYLMSVLVGLENPRLSAAFLAGTALVITATFLYGLPDAPAPAPAAANTAAPSVMGLQRPAAKTP